MTGYVLQSVLFIALVVPTFFGLGSAAVRRPQCPSGPAWWLPGPALRLHMVPHHQQARPPGNPAPAHRVPQSIPGGDPPRGGAESSHGR